MKTVIKLSLADIQAAVAAYVAPKHKGVKPKDVQLNSFSDQITAEVEIEAGAGQDESDADAEDTEVETKPKRTRRSAAAVEEQAEDEDEAPKRRTRRTAKV